MRLRLSNQETVMKALHEVLFNSLYTNYMENDNKFLFHNVDAQSSMCS
jgi:hypothetical protein